METAFYRTTLVPAAYTAVSAARSAHAQSSAKAAGRLHVITAASDLTQGLSDLLFTGKLAGVDVQVVGLGRPYRDYAEKTEWYIEALTEGAASGAIQDDDAVALIDAYDVLLLPSVRQLPRKLQSFPTPVVFCSENGNVIAVLNPFYSINFQ
jgi:hypothetical protein